MASPQAGGKVWALLTTNQGRWPSMRACLCACLRGCVLACVRGCVLAAWVREVCRWLPCLTLLGRGLGFAPVSPHPRRCIQ